MATADHPIRPVLGVVVGIAVISGAVLRFLPMSPMWLDEALSAAIADDATGGMGSLAESLRHDGHPPLYYLLLAAWQSVAGGSAASLRALSGVLGLVSVALIWPAVRQHADRRTAAYAVGVMASSPFAIRYATEVRMYALLLVLLLAGHLVFSAAWRRPDRRRLSAVAMVTAALLLTHYWAFFLVVVLSGALLFGRLRGAGSFRSTSGRLLGAVSAGSLVFVVWLPVFLFQLAHTGTPWSRAPRPTVVVALALEAFGGGKGSEALLVAVVLTVLVVLGLGTRSGRGPAEIGWTELPWLRTTVGTGGATVLLGAAVSLATDSAFQGRYAVFCFVPVVLAAGVGLRRLPQAAGVSALLLLVVLSATSVARELSRDRTQIGVVAAVVDGAGVDGDPVVFCPDQLAPAGHCLLADRFTTMAYPALDDGRTVDWADYAERNAAADPEAVADRIVIAAGGAANVWLVWIDGYETFADQCGRLHAALAARLGRATRPVGADGDEFYNAANLSRYNGPGR